MPSRHRSRQRAVQLLYQWDMRQQPVDEAIHAFYDSLYSSEEHTKDEPAKESPRPERDVFMEQLVHGAAKEAPSLDELITKHAANWRIERMPAVDRNILRLAIYEMKTVGTPGPIVIDEALQLARRFAGDESISFLNGVLDAVRLELGR